MIHLPIETHISNDFLEKVSHLEIAPSICETWCENTPPFAESANQDMPWISEEFSYMQLLSGGFNPVEEFLKSKWVHFLQVRLKVIPFGSFLGRRQLISWN